MSQLLKIFHQTSYQIIGKVVSVISTFVILGIIARNYGPSGTGIFTLTLTYLGIFYLLSDFGFNAHVLRKGSIEWQKLLGTRIIWSVVLVFIAVGLLPFWPFATEEFSRSVLIGSLAIIGSAIFVTANLLFQSKLRYDLSVLSSSIGTIISLFIFILLASLHYPISFLLIPHLLSWLVIAVVALFLVKKLLPKITPTFDKQYTKKLFLESWPIAATLGLNVVYFRADAFLIALFQGIADAGIYNVAYSVFQSALVLPTFIMNAYYPMMLKSSKGLKLVALGLFLLATLGTMLTLILSPFIIELLTGGGFAGAFQSLQILSLGFPAYFLSSLLMWMLVSRGRHKRLLLIYSFGLGVNLVLNFIFIPQYSIYGASAITVVSEYLILALLLVSLRK